jgi:aldehyde dehydrogenase (NAD+)
MLSQQIIADLGLSQENRGACTGQEWFGSANVGFFAPKSPVDGAVIGKVFKASKADYERVMDTAVEAFSSWRQVPAPKRGDIVRQVGQRLRQKKAALGHLVSYEMGKSLSEGLGEVQEMIDICDFSVGLSRQLYGLTMHSERPEHRMYEQWHPVGPVAIITAFNFPVAVWAWNAMIAMVCGDVTIWKPSEKTPLSAIATFNAIKDVLTTNQVPEGVMSLLVGDVPEIGESLIQDRRIPLVSATGSTKMGQRVGAVVGARLGRTILELGGNNAIILTPHANLKLAIPAVVFGAVGTAGQRCTSTRRLIVHDTIYSQVRTALQKAYGGLRIGSPLDEKNHVGPLIDPDAVKAMQLALSEAVAAGSRLVFGGEVLSGPGFESGCYVRPAIVEVEHGIPTPQIVQEETFAPILYLIRYQGGVEDAIRLQNAVKQGLSSAIFTDNLIESECFLAAQGSDCGIANVNIGTSGAEIGGAFGGEKDTGGGRESGSDSWKAYMRRQTNTINYGRTLPLAQGVKFDIQ